ncbi:MAG: hypothetical protein ACTSXP_00970 [Promethearchaeota archaeon]
MRCFIYGAKLIYAIRRDFNKGKLSLEQASKRVFLLLVLIASMYGIRWLNENESYVQ